MKYIDAHCHVLNDAQMRVAVAHGVDGFIVNATDTSNWASVIEIAQHSNVYGAIGVHPWHIGEISNGWDMALVDMLMAHPDLMVGEIGLDKNRPDLERQIAVFTRQLQIAHDMKRVAHIHCVGAWGKVMDILRTNDLPPAIVFHAFSGAVDLVPELVKTGACFSFGMEIYDEKYVRARKAVIAVPESRILVESDTASPDTIPNTVAEIVKLREMGVEQMAEIIYNNTTRLLNGRKI